MNQKALYELTITEKLEQLTAPDMVDAIWARIETQLDTDLPTDDGPANPPAAPKTGPSKWIRRGFIVAVVAIVLIFSFNNRKQKFISTSQPTLNTPVTKPTNTDNTVRNNSPGTNNAITPQRNTSALANPSPVLPVDSNATAPVTLPLQPEPDSSKLNTNPQPVLTPPLVVPQKNPPSDSTKKSRGVKGISDNDYKIVPKKDSGGR